METTGDGDGGREEAGVTGLPWLAESEPGTVLLVAGPPMTGKRRLLYRLLAGDGGGEDVARALVTTRLGADDIADEYRAVHSALPEDRLSVVDCVSDQQTSGFDADDRTTATRRFAHDPGDLTGIGIGVSEFIRGYQDDGLDVWLGVHTLSTMLMYAEMGRVYRFVHVLTGRTRAAGFRGAFVLDEPDDDPGMLAQPFDGLVGVRDGESGTEVRVRGVDVGPDTWTPLASF